jgi:hypothetical protein
MCDFSSQYRNQILQIFRWLKTAPKTPYSAWEWGFTDNPEESECDINIKEGKRITYLQYIVADCDEVHYEKWLKVPTHLWLGFLDCMNDDIFENIECPSPYHEIKRVKPVNMTIIS